MVAELDEFVRAVEASKVPPGSMITVAVHGEPVVIAHVGGVYYGIGAICTHANWDLSEGILKGAAITCSGHGTVWDLRTGKGTFEEPLADEPLYEIKEESGVLFLRRVGRFEASKS